jgi:integrase
VTADRSVDTCGSNVKKSIPSPSKASSFIVGKSTVLAVMHIAVPVVFAEADTQCRVKMTIRVHLITVRIGRERAELSLSISTREETHALLAAARGHRLGAAVALLFLQGWRVSEVLGLAGEDLDLDAGITRVRRASVYVDGRGQTLGPTKTDNTRGERWLMPTVVDLLVARREPQVALTTARQLRERGLSFVVAPRNRTCGPGSRRTAYLAEPAAGRRKDAEGGTGW